MPDPWDDPAQLAALMQRPDMRARLANAALGMPVSDPNALLAASMTHWPEGPNPAAPYIQGAKRIAGDISEFIPGIGGGLQGLANREQIDTPQWSQAIGRALHNEAADTAIGMATPLGSLSQRIAALEQSLGRKLRPDLTEAQVSQLEGAGAAGGKSARYKSLATVQARKAIGEDVYPGAPKQVEEPPPSITAFHGSPHDFDKFDLSKIGTGEGAQAFGHGLYFAENEETARTYQNMVGNTALQAAKSLITHRGGVEGAISYVEEQLKNGLETNRLTGASNYEILDALKAGVSDKGRMYQVSINADPEHFLDWDKPLSEQSPHVKGALGLDKLPQKPTPQETMRVFALAKERSVAPHDLPEYKELERRLDSANRDAWGKLGIDMPISGAYGHPSEMRGSELIGGLAQQHGRGVGNEAVISDKLRAAGIPGIKYLDQGSRQPKTLFNGEPIPQGHAAAQLAAEKLDLHGTPEAAIASLQRDATEGHPYIRQSSKDALGLLQSGAVKRHQPEGTRNYVVFDDKLIDILKKYGLAGLSALPAAGMYHFQQGGDQGAQ